MNITFSVDKAIINRARKRAEALGKSLNQLVREYLQQLAGGDNPREDIERLRQLAAEGQGRSRGWRFNRDASHERS